MLEIKINDPDMKLENDDEPHTTGLLQDDTWTFTGVTAGFPSFHGAMLNQAVKY